MVIQYIATSKENEELVKGKRLPLTKGISYELFIQERMKMENGGTDSTNRNDQNSERTNPNGNEENENQEEDNITTPGSSDPRRHAPVVKVDEEFEDIQNITKIESVDMVRLGLTIRSMGWRN